MPNAQQPAETRSAPPQPQPSEREPVAIESVAWTDPRAQQLRAEMDAELTARYAPGQQAEAPEVGVARARALSVRAADVLETLLAVDDDGSAIGHVAVRRLGDEVEIKRLIVAASARGRGVATALMTRATEIARATGGQRVILQTGQRQPESLALYRKLGFTPIPVYEPYAETMPASLCFELRF